ncbi:hypothetical protein H7J88_25910 [Mycolicibacterium flavescens]|uniref:Intersectin-EH binding protein Ibp1 n=1 Tax=Mycolicibacterium flavescens TaxID=1776 RepID=A0A1E3RCD4_MYCFV|nr:hypothetical protein [Mycolicibacterium flavescens]MCV7283073.1 hypothetical protein [Mycolicibacterium flavescens]ODQ87499.1 hypothetical protein BHQ18_23080 [Mycolicibacterium flavescens]
MRTSKLSARNLIIAGAFTVAATLSSIAPVLATPGPLVAQDSGCSTGEEGDLYTGACVPYLVPNTPGASNVACPTGVSGAECTAPAQPAAPATPKPFQPSPEEQELEAVSTPDY